MPGHDPLQFVKRIEFKASQQVTTRMCLPWSGSFQSLWSSRCVTVGGAR